MRTFILDGETFYSKEYTLRTLTPAEYILDNRFEMIGLAVKELGQPAFWLDGSDNVEQFFRGLDPAETTTISHNALFDNCIWSYRYGFVPALMIDTLGMARALLNLKSYSLGSVAKTLKLPEVKGNEVQQAVGMRLADLKARPAFYEAYKAYALKDARLCEGIYSKLARSFPEDEFFIMDLVLRAAVQPLLHADTELLTSHLDALRKRKARLLRECDYDKAQLMSTTQFRDTLEHLGVMVETKISPTGKQVPAFAKTDAFMEQLQEYNGSPDDDINFKVQVLAAARLAHKSTIEETRAERFLNIAKLPWPNECKYPNCDGGPATGYCHNTCKEHPPLLPVPLRYAGAHTGRLSGEWRMNLQNLPRDQAKSNLRRALVAPPGFKILAADLAQIECRLVACFCNQQDLVEQFRKGDDVYAWFASKLFNKSVTKATHPNERFIGKTAILGLGYGCGHVRFFQMVVALARQYDINIKGLFDADKAERAVELYRSTFPMIKRMWNTIDRHVLPTLNSTRSKLYELGDIPLIFSSGRIQLPNLMELRYDIPDLSLYGAKILENIIQALARNIIMDAALRLEAQGLRFVLQAHDELAFVVPDKDVAAARRTIMTEMVRVPDWMRTLPLAVEIGIGQNYGECK